jgi:1,2-diacylglycerol 3-alpha-glucosyltransferase
MKILIVADTYPPHVNGAALATYRQAVELKKRGHQVYVIAPSTTLKNDYTVEDGIAIFRIRSVLIQKPQEFRVSPQLLVYRRAIKKILTIVEPDIVHVNNPGFLALAVVPAAHRMNIPTVATSHFMPENIVHYLKMPNIIGDVLNNLIWKQYAGFYSKLDYVISPTQTAADLLTKNHLKCELKVISNGIDLKKYKRRHSKAEAKKRFDLPDKKVVLFVGRLDKEKNINVLIEALGIIKNNTDFHAVIAGKGKEMESLVEQAGDLGISTRVTFTGYVSDEDLLVLYNAADVFVMPGIAELQSLVTMEAMASGVPVIAANAVALPHLVKDSENGYLFRPGNPQDLARKLGKLLSDDSLREQMSGRSRELIKVHDMDKIMDQIDEVYRTVLKEKKANGHDYSQEKGIEIDELIYSGLRRLRDVI